MIVLGIDPGETTGWCVYDTEARRVVASGNVQQAQLRWRELPYFDVVVIERPEGQGATRPQVVDCAWWAGQMYGMAVALFYSPIEALPRRAVVKALSTAVGTSLKGDAQVWWALCELHGGTEAARKGKAATKRAPEVTAGPLAGCQSHARAALAVAYAWGLK